MRHLALVAPVLCLIVACAPYDTYPSQPYWQTSQPGGWQQQRPAPTTPGYDEDGYPEDPPARGSYPAQPQRSVSRNSGNSGNWYLCKATASVGTAMGDGPWSYRTEVAYGNGPTKDGAYLRALSDCHAMVRMTIAVTPDHKHQGGTCEVVDCMVGKAR